MRILYTSRRPYYPIRIAHGGQRSTHDLLLATQQIEKVDCAALFCVSKEYFKKYIPKPSQWKILGINKIDIDSETALLDVGYPITALFDDKEAKYWQHLELMYHNFRPNIVMTGQRGAYDIAIHARDKGLAVIWNIDTSPGQGVYQIDNLKHAVRAGVTPISCSKYVSTRIQHLTSDLVKPITVYPPMNNVNYQVAIHNPHYITVINPVPVKGGELLELIVQAFPNENFLFVTGWETGVEWDYWPKFRKELGKYRNVTITPRTPDIRTVLSKTKLLLVPSQWDEAFGRVVWEAQCSGIPSLVSAVGGLPEVLGIGGELIEKYRDPQSWIKRLQDILYDPKLLEKLYSYARDSAKRTEFTPEKNVAAFITAIQLALQNVDTNNT